MDILNPVLLRLSAMTEAQVRALAETSGVPKPTIDKIKFRQTPNPRVHTVERLYSCLCEPAANPNGTERPAEATLT